MSKQLKKLFIIIIVIFLIISFIGCDQKRYNYNQAKEDCIKYFESNYEGLTLIAEKEIQQGSKEDISCEKTYSIVYDKEIQQDSKEDISLEHIDSICYIKDGENDFIIFDYDAQGMLGGQYWGIYYSPDNMFYNEYGTIEYDTQRRYFKEESGNNFFVSERVSDNWFFFYLDFDGNAHGLDWTEEKV